MRTKSKNPQPAAATSPLRIPATHLAAADALSLFASKAEATPDELETAAGKLDPDDPRAWDLRDLAHWLKALVREVDRVEASLRSGPDSQDARELPELDTVCRASRSLVHATRGLLTVLRRQTEGTPRHWLLLRQYQQAAGLSLAVAKLQSEMAAEVADTRTKEVPRG